LGKDEKKGNKDIVQKVATVGNSYYNIHITGLSSWTPQNLTERGWESTD